MNPPLVALAALSLVVACESGPPLDAGRSTLGGAPPVLHKAVCQGGRRHCYARIRTTPAGAIWSSPFAPVGGFGPPDIASAYDLDTTVNPNATIAIVDAFGYTNAESDLAAYRSNYGLPPCTSASGCFTKVNDQGKTSPLPPDPPSSNDWTVETALDLDTASSACPQCKILLVQAQSDQDDSLFWAQTSAVSLGATVISNSWGGPENAPDAGPDAGLPPPAYEHYFAHPGVATFVASGDQGYDNGGQGPDYPSDSLYVIAVGGTSLTKGGGTRGWTETAWTSGGSSCSWWIPKPTWQGNTSCTYRAASDVAAVADPATGVAVYNNGPSNSGWTVVGGTSAASPITAGIFALAKRGGVLPEYAYENPSIFNDVTSGANGLCFNILCNAGTGWDGPTGVGTPDGRKLASTICTPACSGRACGPDGCGSTCGTCSAGLTCNDTTGQCGGCVPQCSGKQCGPDGCGGTCGTCTGGATCDSNGQCEACQPQCSGKNCGPDGCGGSCGTCSGAQTCSAGGQCVSGSAPTIAFSSPSATGTLSGTVTVSLTTTNTTANSSISVMLDGNAWANGTGTSLTQTWDTTSVSDGSHTLSATVTEAGQSGQATRTVPIANNASTGLSVSITTPGNGQTLSNEVTITATAHASSGATLTGVQIYVNTLLAGSGTGSVTSASVDSSRLPDGPYSLTAQATDSSGASQTSAPVNVVFSNGSVLIPDGGRTPDAGSGGGGNGSSSGCSAAGANPSMAWALLGLVALGGHRRRRR